MNLAYLEFIGAIEIDRSPVAVNPAISFDKPIGKTSVKQFTYMDTRKECRNIEELEKQLELAKKEQKQAIKYVYDDIVKLAEETDSSLTTSYIKHELEEVAMPCAIVRRGILWDGEYRPEGDLLFLEDKIVIFMRWFTLDFMEKLKSKFSKDITVYKGICSKDPMEVHIDMSWCLK